MLADEMGLGKTIQVLSLFNVLQHSEALKDQVFMIVCPLTI